MNVLTILRGAAIAGLVAAIGDPGCARPGRLGIAVLASDASSRTAADRVRARVDRDTAAWADVLDDASREAADLRVVVGDAGPVSAHLHGATAALAVRPSGEALAIAYTSGPSVASAGMRSDIEVAVDGVPASGGRLIVTIADRGSGREEARLERTVTAGGSVRMTAPWLAMGDGHRMLRARAHLDAATGVRDAVADLVVDLRQAPLAVSVIEARPSWAARFARLALAPLPDVRLSSEVRTAPGITVRTGQADADEATVLIVGGVDALTVGDVDRVERAVRDGGRVALLVFDHVPGAGPWRRLWPERFGAPVAVPKLRTVDLGGHVWKTREWLSPVLSTQARPLAYSDTRSPVIVGRGVGAGRVVAITALDAWRWRAEDGVAWAAGWQALVQRLAADVPAPLTVRSWVAGEGSRRVLHADVVQRPDVAGAPRGSLAATVDSDAMPPRHLPLWPAGPGRWRGAVPVPPGREATVRVTQTGGSVAADASVVVDLSPAITAATWTDVDRIQRMRGAEAVEEAALGEALEQWRTAASLPPGERWFPTRQWWFAATVLALLGSEWILRRSRRLP